MGQLIFLSLLLLLQRLPSLKADIFTTNIANDSRANVHFQDLCFSEPSYVSISLTDVKITQIANDRKSLNPPNMGFYLLEYNGKWPPKANHVCITESPHLKHDAFILLVSFNHLSSSPPISILNTTVKVPQKGKYGVYFSNCQKTAVSMNVEIQTYDIDHDRQRSYLPDNTTHIGAVLDFYSQFYYEIVLLWTMICCTNMQHFQRIHWLISLLFLIKYVSPNLLVQIKRNGNLMDTPHLWDIVFYGLHSNQVVLLGVVLMLIAYGWSAEKPFLQGIELKTFNLGLAIHILDSVGYIIISKIGRDVAATGYPFSYWGFICVDCLSAFWLVVPFMWSLKSLKRLANEDGDAVRILARMRLLLKMLISAMLYQYWNKPSRLRYPTNPNSFSYSDMSTEDNELFAFIFYAVMLYVMQPREDDYLLLIEEMDEQTALDCINNHEFFFV